MKNWFNRKPDGRDYPKYSGKVVISNAEITFPDHEFKLAQGQYFRIMGSLFNDGVHKYGGEGLIDEVFDGAVWSMAVPPDVVKLADEIAAWVEQYAVVLTSPYQSESKADYSYSLRSAGNASGNNAGNITWQSQFASYLNAYRKI